MSTDSISLGQSLVYLSDLIGVPIRDSSDNHAAKVVDLVARLAVEGYPPITGLLALSGSRQVFIPVKMVTGMEAGNLGIRNARDIKSFDPFKRRAGEVLLKRDILGRKLIHLGEHSKPRLVKASEIDLARSGDSWKTAGIEVRKRRRPFHRNTKQGKEHATFIDWAHLEPFVAHVPTSRLRVSYRKLAKVHPSELADLVESASPAEGEEIIAAVGEDKELEADVFEELDDEHQLELVARRSNAEVASLLSTMAPDDAADLLSEIDQGRRQPILRLMPPAPQLKVRSLLGYNPETAGGLMNPAAISINGNQTVADAIERVRSGEEPYEAACILYVVSSGGKLTGSVNIVELLRTDPSHTVSSVARSDPAHVTTSSDLPDIATAMADYNLTALPVVDDHGILVGQVTVDDLLEELVPENWKKRAELS
ncbi:MAG: CBS domain-containing protein [Actinobacteria bacterium]|nr:CBS domain-containing protein [Actinomycetota bacterium]